MSISEEGVDVETLRLIAGCASDALRILGLNANDPLAEQSPGKASQRIVQKVDEAVYQMQKGNPPAFGKEDDPALILGSLWGEQLVRQLQWQWIGVVFLEHDNARAIGVASPDRSLIIYPFHFIFGCLENGASVTIELSYNMLVDGSRIPKLPANGFENVMDNVHHIVPRP